MTSRTDRKQREIPLARYSYRHEAEFAAGFLDEAGVPYRMQLDDPSMGMVAGMSATIWVRGLDEAWAREVLELGIEPLDEDDDVFEGSGPGGPLDHEEPASGGVFIRRHESRPERPSPAPRREAPPLGPRERGLLLGASVAAGVGGLFLQGAASPIVGPALVVGAVLLGLAGILGWAPDALRRLLRALSGHAP